MIIIFILWIYSFLSFYSPIYNVNTLYKLSFLPPRMNLFFCKVYLRLAHTMQLVESTDFDCFLFMKRKLSSYCHYCIHNAILCLFQIVIRHLVLCVNNLFSFNELQSSLKNTANCACISRSKEKIRYSLLGDFEYPLTLGLNPPRILLTQHLITP